MTLAPVVEEIVKTVREAKVGGFKFRTGHLGVVEDDGRWVISRYSVSTGCCAVGCYMVGRESKARDRDDWRGIAADLGFPFMDAMRAFMYGFDGSALWELWEYMYLDYWKAGLTLGKEVFGEQHGE